MNSEELFDRLGVTAEEIFGYLYSGALLGLLWWKLRQAEVQEFTSAVGGPVYALGTLLLGVGLYSFFFRVVGDFLLFPLQHTIHQMVDRVLLRRSAHHSTSTIRLLKDVGIGLGYRRSAYGMLREGFFPPETRRTVGLAHAELEILYVTAVEMLLGAAICIVGWSEFSPTPLVAGGIIFSLAAMAADTKQHMQEAAQLRHLGLTKAVEFLQTKGFECAATIRPSGKT